MKLYPLKRIAAMLPTGWRQKLKRCYYPLQYRLGVFKSEEPEFDTVKDYVSPSDWVFDIGANVGHYTAKLSKLVGPDGRVFAFEPVSESFELLTANSRFFPHANVTLLNIAASDKKGLASMAVPTGEMGLKDYYMAHLTDSTSHQQVFCLSIDSLQIEQVISLIKIDTEGHELAVLMGMKALLERCHPTLIVEANTAGEAMDYVRNLGYTVVRQPNSPNCVCQFKASTENAAL